MVDADRHKKVKFSNLKVMVAAYYIRIVMIYFHPIKYCVLVLTDPNHLSMLALRLEEDGGTFRGAKTPPSVFFEARTCFE